jgi:biotin synthase
MVLDDCIQKIKDGKNIDFDLAYQLATTTPADELFEAADHIRRYLHEDAFDLCSIINAKSGKCSEDCRFCAQSAHYDAEITTYDIISTDEAVTQAKESDSNYVERISLVTAGREASHDELNQYGAIYKELQESTDLRFCASMGMLTHEKARILKSYGVERYHCNLEACKAFFSKICSTHTWEEKVETIKIAQEEGLEVCSGGIFGMGETLKHRLELAFELRELEIYSIPINVLTPIANTPFEGYTPLSLSDVLISVAAFRFINPQAIVRLAGGRNQLGEEQFSSFQAGANGAIVGNYLTTAGNKLEDDLQEIKKLGYKFNRENDE